MARNKNINLNGIVLFLIYIFSLIPIPILHQHNYQNVVSLELADNCEKAIYYGIRDNHENHLSITFEDCWLCDHHVAAPQILFNYSLELSSFDSRLLYIPYFNSFYSFDTENCKNKDPPQA